MLILSISLLWLLVLLRLNKGFGQLLVLNISEVTNASLALPRFLLVLVLLYGLLLLFSLCCFYRPSLFHVINDLRVLVRDHRLG